MKAPTDQKHETKEILMSPYTHNQLLPPKRKIVQPPKPKRQKTTHDKHNHNFCFQANKTNLHLLNWNLTSLAKKLQKPLLHKIHHTPHPEQRETDKKSNL